MRQPFYGTLALYLIVEEDATIETMATDGKRLIYSSKFLDELDVECRERLLPEGALLEGVVAHEVTHCAYRHHTRRGDRDPSLWNEAADYAINRDLIAGGFHLPKDVLIDARFGDMSAEEIYRILDAERPKPSAPPPPKQGGQGAQQPQGGQQPGQQQPGQQPGAQPGAQADGEQSGQGKKAPDPGRCGGVIDAAPEHDQAAIAEQDSEWEARIREACAVAAKAGNMPGGAKAIAKEADRARTDWRHELRHFIDARSRQDYSFARPNRRMMASGFCFPSLVPDGMSHLAVAIDTSGSIDMKLLGIFRSQLQAAFDEGAAEKLTVVYCDTAIHATQEFQRGDAIEFLPARQGGTKFSPVFKWIEENADDVSALIYFTDLDCDDFGAAPSYPVLWAVYGKPGKHVVPFGEVIEVY
jgi:predicted metal-dependent peptidase